MVFKIVMLNIRSLFPSVDLVSHYFREYDVICLCETWLTHGHTDNMIKIPGFEHTRLDRAHGNILNSNNHPKRGGGLIIYYKSELSPYIKVLPECTKITPHSEQLWVLLNKPNLRKEIISLIYRPPSGNCTSFFDELINSTTIAQEYSNAEITILGDINIDYRQRHSPDFSRLKDFERDFQLRQLIDTPTRITARNSSILDIILTNMEYVDNSGVLDYRLSDHSSVFVTKKKPKFKKSFLNTKGRTYKHYNKHDFQQHILNDARWEQFWDPANTVDDMWQYIYDIVLCSANITCPFVNMKIANDNPEWFSHELLEEIYLKDEFFREYIESKSEIKWELYRNQRNRVKFLIKSGKEEYLKDQIEQNSGDPKKFWRIINNTTGLGKERKNTAEIHLFDGNNNTIHGKEAVEYMNEYYASAGYNLLNKFQNTWPPNVRMFGDYLGFSFSDINEYEVLKIVKEIKPSKSSAYSDISTRLFKDAFEVICRELTYLFNICISNGVFPIEWGLAEVTPIPKTGDLHNVKNWRPISQIKLPGKLLERLVHNQLSNYFKDILNNNQHGFRNNRSTGTAIFEVLQTVYQSWNERKYSSCIFIDYSKAFDTIDHSILLKKLEIYGLDKNSLKFFGSYLASRQQRIKINNDISPYSKLRCGVPQGSILGPLLFIIYTNDIFHEVDTTGHIYMYADDTLLLNTGKTELQAVGQSQSCFDKVIAWCELNRFTINQTKTKHLCISNKKHLLNATIRKDTEILGNVETYEYLGFNMDRRLTMNPFIDKIIKKVSYRIYTLNIMRRYISEKTALLIYKVMIMPHFDYVDFVIDSATKVKTERLERLHKRAIRTIEYSHDIDRKETLTVLFVRYNLVSLYQRRVEHLLVFMYKLGKYKIEDLDLQRTKIELRSRNKVKFKHKYTGIVKVQNSPLYRGIFLWDQLPITLQLEQNLLHFKREVRLLASQNKLRLCRA